MGTGETPRLARAFDLTEIPIKAPESLYSRYPWHIIVTVMMCHSGSVLLPIGNQYDAERKCCTAICGCPCGEVFIQTDGSQRFCSPRFDKKENACASISRSKNIAYIEA